MAELLLFLAAWLLLFLIGPLAALAVGVCAVVGLVRAWYDREGA